jgi:serine O-acetyltransferase
VSSGSTDARLQRGGDLDQIHIPDPVSQEICKIDVEIDALSKRLNTLSREENKQ